MGRKLDKEKPELHPVPVRAPWFHLGIDFIGPIKPTTAQGNNYILTVTDYFTKFVEAVALPDKSACGVAKTLFKVSTCRLLCYIFFIHLYRFSCGWEFHGL